MRQAQTFFGSLTRFSADSSGNFAVLTAAVCGVLFLSAGFALNLAQIEMTRSNLLNALDSAISSTARDITTGKIAGKEARTTVEAFLLANGGTGFASADRIALDSLVIDKNKSTVAAEASVDINLAFPLFGMGSTRHITADSAAVYSDKKIEIAMMLDITGSMKGSKLNELKSAARNAVDTFLSGQNPDNPRVRVALVPYADAVNTGTLANNVFVEQAFTTGEPPRLDDPRLAGFVKPDNCATERKGRFAITDASPYEAMVNRDVRLDSCPTAALQPLSTDAGKLKSAIGKFRAAGYTAGHIGVQWSWYLLSPKWASVLPTAAKPADYDTRHVAKYAVLMTDGEFNTAFAGVPQYERTAGGQPTRSRNNAQALCDAMKNDGIEIFTIGFMLNEPQAKAVMGDCASPDKSSVTHYFETGSGEELDQAFQTIARNIERLALTR